MKALSLSLTLCSLIMLSGCFGSISAPSQFFTLQTEKDIPIISTKKISVGVLPVQLPDYLDKPQIVLNNGSTQMTVSETNRWIASLSTVTQQALINNMQKTLPDSFVKTKRYDDDNYNFIIRVEINQMTGIIEKKATLSVWWSVLNNSNTEIYRSYFKSEV